MTYIDVYWFVVKHYLALTESKTDRLIKKINLELCSFCFYSSAESYMLFVCEVISILCENIIAHV